MSPIVALAASSASLLAKLVGTGIGLMIFAILASIRRQRAADRQTPRCPTCARLGTWGHTHWVCLSCEDVPCCRGCGLAGRWYPEARAWGCDRCRITLSHAA